MTLKTRQILTHPPFRMYTHTSITTCPEDIDNVESELNMLSEMLSGIAFQ